MRTTEGKQQMEGKGHKKQEATNMLQTLVKDVAIVKQDLGEVKEDVERINNEVVILRQDLGEVKQDLSKGEVKQDLDNVKQDLGEVKQDLSNVKQDLGEVKKDLKKGFEDLDKRLGFQQNLILAGVAGIGGALVTIGAGVVSLAVKAFGFFD